jgi:S1-C subfamily serine protease
MKRACFAILIVAFLPRGLSGQETETRVQVKAILVDSDLTQKPVPHLTVIFSRESTDRAATYETKTGFDGSAELPLLPGRYKLTTPQGVDFQGHHYGWAMDIDINGQSASVELSNDNAHVTDLAPAQPARKFDDLTSMFQKYQKSVVTVWSEIGSGTGFIVDSAGLIMTNQHVIGPSQLISIQFDPQRKVVATLLAFDAERDVAVLYANLTAFPDALPAPIAKAQTDHDMAIEGERVFTIGSPLGLKKIITSGIVSKVEERAIISDVNINHGNSGGPLFNSLGEVIGITTFLVPGGNGPGVSGVVRIDQTLPILEQARRKMGDVPLPDARLLPVEPTDPYPLDSLKETIQSTKFDRKAYVFSMNGFDVALETPVLKYRLEEEASLAAAQEKRKRTGKHAEAVQNTFEPLQDLRGWAEYAGEYKPILLVQASPQLRETFMSALGRGLASSNGGYGGPAHMKFKTDFYKMKLYCGSKEIEPIQPGKAATVVNAHNAFVNVTDATYVGIYSYPPTAISPSCGKVTLQLYSEKEPDKPETKELDQKSVERIWADFQPYLDTHAKAESSK